jgi:hypothetical protein
MKNNGSLRYITCLFLVFMMMVALGSVGQAEEEISLVWFQGKPSMCRFIPIFTAD